MSRLVGFIPPLESRTSLTWQSFVRDFLPTLIFYYTTAVLVLLPHTFPIRLSLLPLTLWSAFHTVASVDLSDGQPGHAYMNQGLCLAMMVLAMRVIDWTFVREPLDRKTQWKPAEHEGQNQKAAQGGDGKSLGKVAWTAFDLIFNLRGIGWNWSEGLKVPAETRPTSRGAFIWSTLLSTIKDLLIFDALLYSVQSFSPGLGSPSGGSIFDLSLPPHLRYLLSSFISLIGSFVVYWTILLSYDLATLFGMVILQQHPSQWPPIFNDPWQSESLNELWSTRWHQLFRRCFISIGGTPLYYLFGPAGGVFGAFLVSGVLHYVGLWAMGAGSDFWRVAGFFLLGGVGAILESLWKKVTGKRVEGWYGWTWTMLWSVGWSNMLIDSWASKGLVGSVFIPQPRRPTTKILEFIHWALA